MNLRPEDFFDIGALSRHRVLFEGCVFVWEVLKRLPAYLREHIRPLPSGVPLREPLPRGVILCEGEVIPLSEVEAVEGRFYLRGEEIRGAVLHAGAILMDREVELAPGVVVEPGALIYGPSWIGPNTQVRQGAYVRGEVLAGEGCVIGHTTEVKRAVFLDGAKAGHFAYVGDSLLGRGVNLGAGTKLANLKLARGHIKVRLEGEVYDTGLRKFGAVLGDGVQTGCNSVTNPGTLVGPGSYILPNVTAGPGVIPPRSIVRK
ncbi:glucose-1-phosphate thymidylyltransferase [Thermosulfurimonas sp. F29]|uniref:glucose-1-phosphate thymidylyltransferase n=1 Tax=Thermosulfurimonas sp. F29 TaxID=2867247 RepID=UPI00351D786E